MITLKASTIASIINGTLYGDDCEINGSVEISSKSCTSGSIFVAIAGEKVDGHDYVSDAESHGAVLIISTREVGSRCIVVENPIEAITLLARHIRTQLPEMKVIAITGSQGKTTTKELLASALRIKGEVVAPSGNHNNEIGVPLTLLKCSESTEFCVVEMGARHQGDILHLSSIAQQHIGVVLRVAAAHIGEFGSLENIALAKSEMIQGLSPEGIAVLGDYDAFTPSMRSLHQGDVLMFGEKAEDDVRAADIELRDGRPYFDLVTPEGRSTVALRLVGAHQIANALAAATVLHALKWSAEEIAGALSLAENDAKWRMELHELPDLLLINDAYNASPDSMAAAIRTLAHLSQERGGESWAFLGKMAELGESAVREHEAIGTLALEMGIDHLVAIGAPEYGALLMSDGATSIHICADKSEAEHFINYINRGDVVLCKGSRSAGLEEIAAKIEESWMSRIEEQA
ncbi:MAG: hypothetical protein RJA33_919 [Actinomycetota bacterium]